MAEPSHLPNGTADKTPRPDVHAPEGPPPPPGTRRRSRAPPARLGSSVDAASGLINPSGIGTSALVHWRVEPVRLVVGTLGEECVESGEPGCVGCLPGLEVGTALGRPLSRWEFEDVEG